MVITNHFVDVNDNAWFTMSTPEYDFSEDISSQDMLSIDPTQIELYYYLNTITTTLPPQSSSSYDVQENMQSMIMDYFEVECNDGALDLVESSLIAHHKPSNAILQAMISLLLRKRDNQQQQGEQYKAYWILADKTHGLLLKIVTLFGSTLFDYLWDTFDHNHMALNKKRHQQQQLLYQHTEDPTYSGDAEMDESSSDHTDSLVDGLSAFDDFWDFVARCFQPVAQDTILLETKSSLHVLDILITIMEHDFQSKRDCSANVKKARLLKTLQKNVVGGWDRFERYLDILLAPYVNQTIAIQKGDNLSMIHVKQKEYAGRLFNMLVAMSRYDITLSMTDLADQTFRKSTQLGADCLIQLVQYLGFDTFILRIFDCGFMTANWSNVPSRYHYLKKKTQLKTSTISSPENTSIWLEKWIHAYTQLDPPHPIQWSTVYLHVWMVKQYYQRVVNVSSLRYHGRKGRMMVIRGCNDLDQDTLPALLDDHLVNTHWSRKAHAWMGQCRRISPQQEDGNQWERKIGWLLDTFIF